jgi:hypothetical protein
MGDAQEERRHVYLRERALGNGLGAELRCGRSVIRFRDVRR